METLVDLPAPLCKGTYVVLFEPDVVKIGTSNCIQKRVTGISTSTFRRVALLAWTDASEQSVYRRFKSDRITVCREFFRLSQDLLSFVNRCREDLGFSSIEEVQLWEFGGPLPQGLDPIESGIPFAWEDRLRSLSSDVRPLVFFLLTTARFRDQDRRDLRDKLVRWLDGPDVELTSVFTELDLATLRSTRLTQKSPTMGYEERSKLGRYYTHLRWHLSPKSTCEFCQATSTA
jgi:hypothetical protein